MVATKRPPGFWFFNGHGCWLFIWAYFHWDLSASIYLFDIINFSYAVWLRCRVLCTLPPPGSSTCYYTTSVCRELGFLPDHYCSFSFYHKFCKSLPQLSLSLQSLYTIFYYKMKLNFDDAIVILAYQRKKPMEIQSSGRPQKTHTLM